MISGTLNISWFLAGMWPVIILVPYFVGIVFPYFHIKSSPGMRKKPLIPTPGRKNRIRS